MEVAYSGRAHLTCKVDSVVLAGGDSSDGVRWRKVGQDAW